MRKRYRDKALSLRPPACPCITCFLYVCIYLLACLYLCVCLHSLNACMRVFRKINLSAKFNEFLAHAGWLFIYVHTHVRLSLSLVLSSLILLLDSVLLFLCTTAPSTALRLTLTRGAHIYTQQFRMAWRFASFQRVAEKSPVVNGNSGFIVPPPDNAQEYYKNFQTEYINVNSSLYR